MSEAPLRCVIERSESKLWIGSVANVLVVSCDSPAGLAGYGAAKDALLKLARRHPGVALVLHVVGQEGQRWSAASDVVRLGVAGLLSVLSPGVGSCLVVVVEAQGFSGATLRSVFSGAITTARPGFPTRLVSSRVEALEWLQANWTAAAPWPSVGPALLGAWPAPTAGA